MNVLAEEALAQIDEKKYETELLRSETKEIIKIGIAFRGKNAVVKNIVMEVNCADDRDY